MNVKRIDHFLETRYRRAGIIFVIIIIFFPRKLTLLDHTQTKRVADRPRQINYSSIKFNDPSNSMSVNVNTATAKKDV